MDPASWSTVDSRINFEKFTGGKTGWGAEG